jgi:DNA-binding MarR family transcriptional regulator
VTEDPSLEDLANQMHSGAIHLLRHVAEVDAGSGLSPARLSALSVIVYGGPLTMTELAAAERVSAGTITSSVTGLESSGLVTRRREGRDARQVTVEATEAGRTLMAESRQRRIAVLLPGLASLSDQERAAVATATAATERMLRRIPC